ncbi:MAG: NAD(P)H-dependent oxidoreductase [Pseudomonadota bacterium]
MNKKAKSAPLLIVWHSRTGASEQIALAAAKGAEGEGPARLLEAHEAQPSDFRSAGAYLFVCPENLGTMSGAMKEMFDRTYYPLLGEIEGRAYGTIIAAGSDGTGAQRQLDQIVTGWRLKRVVEPIIINFEAQTPEAINAPKHLTAAYQLQCEELGQAMGAGLALGLF